MKYTAVIIFSILIFSCQSKKETEAPQSLNTIIDQSLSDAIDQYMELDKAVADTLMPRSTNPDGSLMTNKSWWWTSGFFPGSLWYLYENSGDERVLELAKKRTNAIAEEQWNSNDHDIGFKMYCSFGNGLRIVKDSLYTEILMNSANSLTQRFRSEVGLIRSWGGIDDLDNYLVIIDNMMNLELLFWATKFSGDSTFYNIAVSHADSTMKNHYRPDGSSWHVLEYDPITGEVTKKRTAQGYADNSAWARGQSWGLYGYIVCYRATGDKKYLDHAIKIADFLINHPDLPENKIPYWDFNAPDIPNALRDASAGAIMGSALIELSDYVDGEKGEQYLEVAKQIVQTLSSEEYRAKPGTNNNFLLMHSVGHKPENSEVDVPLSYADYYYIEAMMRLKNGFADGN